MVRMFLSLFISLMFSQLYGQLSNLGVPFIENYSRSDYNGGSQTWDILQGSNGMMYFANNEGLLEFDGSNWSIYSLPNGSNLRSVEQGEGNIIYAGGYDELGFYEISEMGGAKYSSLVYLIPEDQRDFGDVWKIYRHPDGIIFQTYYQLFIFKDNNVEIIEAPFLFHFSYLVDNEYYVNDMKYGLMRYAMGQLFPLKGMEDLIGKEIWGIFPHKGKLAIVTAFDGVYLYNGNSLTPLDSETNDYLKRNQVYCTYRLPDGRIAFGTIQNGVLITTEELLPINYISKTDGLQNNTILCMQTDFLGNLWLGTDHGIDYLELNLPLSEISSHYNLSTGYTALIDNGIIYFGTNQGLFTIGINSVFNSLDKEINLIKETEGQVWTLQKFGNSIFCGHNNGTFLIKDNNATKLSNVPGGWIYRQVPGNPKKIIGGTYTGLVLFEEVNGSWTYSGELEGFNQSSRKMEFDNDGSLWITHGYKGIYHVFFNTQYDSIIKVDFYRNMEEKLKGSSTNMAKIDNKILFTSDIGLLSYDSDSDKFIVDLAYNKVFEGIDIQALYEDDNGNIWYFDGNGAGVMRYGEDGNYTNVQRPFNKLHGEFVNAFEFVYPYDERNVLFATENGFVHYDPKFQKDYSYRFETYLKSLKTEFTDSTYTYNELESSDVILDFVNNEVEFKFSANDFESYGNTEYSTFLKGNDKEWSDWDSRNTRNYTNLYEGDYLFQVRARNIYGTISDVEEISFKVKPPYFRSIAAYIVYGILFILLLGFIMLIMRRRFIRAKLRSEKEQKEQFRRKEERLQRESLEAEKEIIRMRNEKLREGLKLKDKELANSTMQMLQKNEMLITLREELKRLEDIVESETQKHDIFRLIRGINKEIDNEKQWKVFETHFESVHEEFLKRIMQTYPNLTPRELKLCAYLRMNISSKEISVLMNISTRGVEISRYRLRKKLGISRETNLTEFILSF